MYFMVGIKSYDFVIAGLIHNMNTETFCNLVMIDLIPLETVIVVRPSPKAVIHLIHCHSGNFIKESLKILYVPFIKFQKSVAPFQRISET